MFFLQYIKNPRYIGAVAPSSRRLACKILKHLYEHKENVIICNDSAENIDNIVKEEGITTIDYVVSGFPFTSLPRSVSEHILKKTAKLTK